MSSKKKPVTVARINPGLASLVRPIDSVRLDPKNAMHHPEKNLDAIRASLTRHGQQKAIVADKTGIVLAGNGTLEAARSLGWTEIAVVEYDGDSASLARAYAIEDNQTAKLAEWDIPALQLSLDEIRLDFPDLADLGFDEKEMRTIGVRAHDRVVPLDGMPVLSDADHGEFQQMAFILTSEQVAIVRAALDSVKVEGDGNKNSAALTAICRRHTEMQA